MKSSWLPDVAPILRKEFIAEFRSRHSVMSAVLFATLTVVAVSLPSYYSKIGGEFAAVLLIVSVIFAVLIVVPRLFLLEDEQGTLDTLRLIADPRAAYLGKAIYGGLLSVLTSLVVWLLFSGLTSTQPDSPLLAGCGLVGFALATSMATAFASAIVIGASNRWILALVASLPVCLPLVFLGVAATAGGYGSGKPDQAWMFVLLLWLSVPATGLLGTIAVGALWNLSSGASSPQSSRGGSNL